MMTEIITPKTTPIDTISGSELGNVVAVSGDVMMVREGQAPQAIQMGDVLHLGDTFLSSSQQPLDFVFRVGDDVFATALSAEQDAAIDINAFKTAALSSDAKISVIEHLDATTHATDNETQSMPITISDENEGDNQLVFIELTNKQVIIESGYETSMLQRGDVIQALDDTTLTLPQTEPEAISVAPLQAQPVSDNSDIPNNIPTVNPTDALVNDIVLNADTANADEDSAIIIDVLANDSIPDERHLDITDINTDETVGTASLNPDGTIAYDPAGGFDDLGEGETAQDTVTYTATDDEGNTYVETVDIIVTGNNDAPIATADTATTDEDNSVNIDALINDSDTDANDILSVISVDDSGISGTVSLNPDGTINYDPNGMFDDLVDGETVIETFSYTIDDGEGGTSIETVTVTVTGSDDGVLLNPDTAATDESTVIDIDVLANDTVLDTNLVLTVIDVDGSNTQGSVSLNPDGTVRYDPDNNFEMLAVGETATDTLTYTIDDGNGNTAIESVTITIIGTNDGPISVADMVVTDENNLVDIDVLGNDSDIDGDSLSIQSIDNTGLQGTVGINPDGTLNYDPAGAFDHLAVGETATETFSYTVADNNGGTSTENVTVTITGENNAPTAVADTAVTTESSRVNIDLLANDVDVDTSDDLSLVSIDTTGTVGNVVLRPDGTVDYYPWGEFEALAPGETATDSFTYVMTDGQGATSTETVTVTITGENDAPSSLYVSILTSEGQVSTFADDFLSQHLADVDNGDTVQLTGITQNDVGQLNQGSSFTVESDGTYTYDQAGAFDYLSPGETAIDSFTYTFEDSYGAEGSRTITIFIQGLNDNPVAIIDAAFTLENAAIDIDVLANDSDVDASDVLSLVSIETNGLQGTASINPDGTIHYDPAGTYDSLAVGETAIETFSYTVSDTHGGTSVSTVTVTVVGEGDGPVAVADVATTHEDNVIDIDVLSNDSNMAASGTLNIHSVDSSGLQGSVAINPDGTLRYDPAGAFDSLAVGEIVTEMFNYTVIDNNGSTATESVTVTITGTNDAPVAVADTAMTTESSRVNIDLLANDLDVDTSDQLSLVSIDITGTIGNVILRPDGTVDYYPWGEFEALAPGETATDSFTYVMTDGHGTTSTETVTVTINGENDAPSSLYIAFTAGENHTNTFADNFLSQHLADIDNGDSVHLTGITQNDVGQLNGGGTFTVEPDGSYLYDPAGAFDYLNPGETAIDSFTYTFEDSYGAQGSRTVTAFVYGTNDTPIAVLDEVSTLENAAIDIDVLANDSDVDANDVLNVISINTNSLQGTASINPDGTIHYDPAGAYDSLAVGETAIETFSYTVSDTHGGTAVENVTITITGTDDTPVAAVSYIEGTSARDVITGSAGSDIIHGENLSVQSINALAQLQASLGSDAAVLSFLSQPANAAPYENSNVGENDTIFGNGGDDVIFAEGGDDIVDGGTGNDVIYGGIGADTINAGEGDDVIVAGSGNDIVDGGVGIDTIDYSTTDNGVIVNLTTGEAVSSIEQDSLLNIENVTGSAQADTLTGDTQDNIIEGLAGDDIIFGMAGDDTLDGGAGDDMMYGGAGDDVVIYDGSDVTMIDGGIGIDTLQFGDSVSNVTLDLTSNSSSGLEIEGIDVIDLTGGGDNTLILDLNQLLGITDSNELYVAGDSGDTVSTTDSGWTLVETNGGYNHYTNGMGSLHVDTDITNQDVS